MILHWHDATFECSYAVRTNNEIILYDSEYNVIEKFFNVPPSKWDNFQLEGGNWSNTGDVPTDMDRIRADIDYLLMRDQEMIAEISEIYTMINPLFADEVDEVEESSGS